MKPLYEIPLYENTLYETLNHKPFTARRNEWFKKVLEMHE